MQRLGAALTGCQRVTEAEPLLAEAVARYRTLAGHPPQGLVASLGNLASVQWHTGARQSALTTMEEAVQIARRELPSEDFVVSVSLTNLATMVTELGDKARAIELLEDARRRSVAAGRLGEAATQRQLLDELRRP